jgi:V-type H+-transporting ATPase subunit G
MSQHSQEVQLLLAAEKRASEKVAEARKRKARRLKQAKEEAAADIEQFKAERQLAFQKYESEHMGSRGDIAKRIDQETNEKLELMAKRIESTKKIIIDRLIEEVISNCQNATR